MSVIGSKIKRARVIRKFKQVDLAKKLNLAASRLAHYESGFRTPKKDLLKNIANELDTTIYALQEPSIEEGTFDVIALLIDLEEKFGLTIKREKEKDSISYYLSIDDFYIQEYLRVWDVIRIAYNNNEITDDEYDDWKLKFTQGANYKYFDAHPEWVDIFKKYPKKTKIRNKKYYSFEEKEFTENVTAPRIMKNLQQEYIEKLKSLNQKTILTEEEKDYKVVYEKELKRITDTLNRWEIEDQKRK